MEAEEQKKPSWLKRTLVAGTLVAGGTVGTAAYMNQDAQAPAKPDAQNTTQPAENFPDIPSASNQQEEIAPERPGFELAKRSAGNMYNTLSHYEFTNQQGHDLDLKNLYNKLDSNTVLSFGFSACEGICPNTNANLAKLGRKHPDMQYLVVSSWEKDGESQAARNDYLAKLAQQGLDPKRVTIIYPKDRGNSGQRKLQKDFGERIVGSAPGHTSLVFLHDGKGTHIGKHRGNTTSATAALSDMIDHAEKRIER